MRSIPIAGGIIGADSEIVTAIRVRGNGFKYGVEIDHYENFLSDKEIESIGMYIALKDEFLVREHHKYPRYPLYIMRQLISKGK